MVALLGKIHPEVRLIKVTAEGSRIQFSAIVSPLAGEEALEALSEAGSEIIASFPEYKISEDFKVSADALPKEDVVREGWLYQRVEP